MASSGVETIAPGFGQFDYSPAPAGLFIICYPWRKRLRTVPTMDDSPFLYLLLGFILGLLPSWLARKQRLRTHWAALRAEVNQCRNKAETPRTDKKAAPLYRLPDLAYVTSFPVLLVDAAINEEEITAISEFYDFVQQINRGLNRSAEATTDEKMREEHGRNLLKVHHIIDQENGAPSRYDVVAAILDKKIKARWWKFDPYA